MGRRAAAGFVLRNLFLSKRPLTRTYLKENTPATMFETDDAICWLEDEGHIVRDVNRGYQLEPTGRKMAARVAGKHFHCWLVLYRVLDKGTDRNPYYMCMCVCGNEHAICGTSLRNEHTKSCGCKKARYLRKANRKHGGAYADAKTIEYMSWRTMRQRAAERGESIVPEWEHYINFKRDMCPGGKKPPRGWMFRLREDLPWGPSNTIWVKREHLGSSKDRYPLKRRRYYWWTVLSGPLRSGMCWCYCSCGTIQAVRAADLREGKRKHCDNPVSIHKKKHNNHKELANVAYDYGTSEEHVGLRLLPHVIGETTWGELVERSGVPYEGVVDGVMWLVRSELVSPTKLYNGISAVELTSAGERVVNTQWLGREMWEWRILGVSPFKEKRHMLCLCTCGKVEEVRATDLLSGRVPDCGCGGTYG